MAHTGYCPDMVMDTICVPLNGNYAEISPEGGALQFANVNLPMTSIEACEPIIVSTPFPSMVEIFEDPEGTRSLGKVNIPAGFSRIVFQKGFASIAVTIYLLVGGQWDQNIFVSAWRESDFVQPNR